jgi:hypothetical protein
MAVSGVEGGLARQREPLPRRTEPAIGVAVFVTWALLAAGCAPAEPAVRLDGYGPASEAVLCSAGWRTDLDRAGVPLERILAGGPSREAFVPIVPVETVRADEVGLGPEELVLVVRAEGAVRGWPIAHLAARELALDEVGGTPVAVTYCSLCASGRVWDRRLGGEVLDLAVSGLVLDGNGLLYDRGTESLWRQLTGEAIAGARAGSRLAALPAFTVELGVLRSAHPDAQVMLAPGGPEPPIDRIDARDVETGVPPPWLDTTCADPLATVLALPGELVVLEREPAVQNLSDVVVLCGSAFLPQVDGRPLRFEGAPGGARDLETGSVWNALGEAVAGPLLGRWLEPAPQSRVFRFAAPARGLPLADR